MAYVKVYVKKQIQIDKMNVDQREMLALASLGLRSIKERIQNAVNTNDAPAKPLRKGYAIYKAKQRAKQKAAQAMGQSIPRNITGKRDLTLTGAMLANLSVRTVSENRAFAGWTTKKNKDKARNNQRIEEFVDFSPKNEQVVFGLAQKLVGARVKRLVISRSGVIK